MYIYINICTRECIYMWQGSVHVCCASTGSPDPRVHWSTVTHSGPADDHLQWSYRCSGHTLAHLCQVFGVMAPHINNTGQCCKTVGEAACCTSSIPMSANSSCSSASGPMEAVKGRGPWLTEPQLKLLGGGQQCVAGLLSPPSLYCLISNK